MRSRRLCILVGALATASLLCILAAHAMAADDEVEGHMKGRKEADDDTEGHLRRRTEEDDDTEGHGRRRALEDGVEDVEGHIRRKKP